MEVRGLLGDPDFRVNCATCSHTRLVSQAIKDDNGNVTYKWVCDMNGNTSHLSGGAQYSWEFPSDIKKREESQKKNGVKSSDQEVV